MTGFLFQLVGLLLDLVGLFLTVNGFFVVSPLVWIKSFFDSKRRRGLARAKDETDETLVILGVLFIALGFLLQGIGLILSTFSS